MGLSNDNHVVHVYILLLYNFLETHLSQFLINLSQLSNNLSKLLSQTIML